MKPDPRIVRKILEKFALPAMSTHGLPHWARVLENGKRMSSINGADIDIVALFSVFHDCGRVNEVVDPGHGLRGAELLKKLRGKLFALANPEFELLEYAIVHHTDGLVDRDITIGTCWDADRLDLWRVAMEPDKALMNTEAALDDEVWAPARHCSIIGYIPGYVLDKWLGADG